MSGVLQGSWGLGFALSALAYGFLFDLIGWRGLLWIGMSLACLWAVRQRVLPLRIAVAVAVLGGIGPFFGSAEFIREQRRRDRAPS